MTAKKSGKSQSARANLHDWDALSRIVEADQKESLAALGLDWDERYVSAIQRALDGRDNAPLFTMLDDGLALHPALLPALADVIRSQRDNASGAGKALTRHQDRLIREYFDRMGPSKHLDVSKSATLQWLADVFKTSVKTIRRSLRDTGTK